VDNQKILAIIPARSGSKGLEDKNIRLLVDKPLIAYTILAAQESGIFDEIFVSTDSAKYVEIAREYGVAVPFLRPSFLATDTVSSWDVVKNILIQFKKDKHNFDIAVLLQPTSPLRSSKDIQNALVLYKEKNANAIVSVCEADHSPLWCNTLPSNHSLDNFIKQDVKNKPRQLLEKYYRINGAIYIVDIHYLLTYFDIYHNNCYAYIMPKSRSIDIDDEVDFLLVETLLKKQQ
jgi:CMP-N,N'-diacetyllegionaminic acid synthase